MGEALGRGRLWLSTRQCRSLHGNTVWLQHYPAARGPGGDKSCALIASDRLSLPHCPRPQWPWPKLSHRQHCGCVSQGTAAVLMRGLTSSEEPAAPASPGGPARLSPLPLSFQDAQQLEHTGWTMPHLLRSPRLFLWMEDLGTQTPRQTSAGRASTPAQPPAPFCLLHGSGKHTTFTASHSPRRPALGPESEEPSSERPPSSLTSGDQPRTARGRTPRSPPPIFSRKTCVSREACNGALI